MKAQPIIMQKEAAESTWDGRKSQIRHPLDNRLQVLFNEHHFQYADDIFVNQSGNVEIIMGDLQDIESCFDRIDYQLIHNNHYVKCPFGKVDDLLWVREGLQLRPMINRQSLNAAENMEVAACYEASPDIIAQLPYMGRTDYEYIDPKFMRRSLSRLTLKITSIRIERLHDISHEDAVKEGCSNANHVASFKGEAQNLFKKRWLDTHGKRSWNNNPWVWVIDFELIKQNVDHYINQQTYRH
ncbi:MAG: hypothetical protein MK137_04410 [Rickettsiales bacterium]|nr:hypothetical protein [Rickettsiales bacterium]